MTADAHTGSRLVDLLADAEMVFFDCDGVLLDSNAAKIAAARAALAGAPDDGVERCIAQFRRDFGQPRQHHFARFADLLGVADRDRTAFLNAVAARYEAHLQDSYPRSPAIPGARALVETLARRGIATHVVTGAAATEAAQALDAQGFGALASRVHGAARAKHATIADLLDQAGVSPERAVFLGDAEADAAAAGRTRVPFVFVRARAIATLEDVLARLRQGAVASAYVVQDLDPDGPVTAVSSAPAQGGAARRGAATPVD